LAIPLLLAATSTRWSSPARLPYELTRAGFEVTVLAPREALVTRSKYVTSVSTLPDGATPLQWAQLLAAAVRQSSPRLIVPCDDTALQLMIAFLEAPPAGFEASLRDQLLALIVESLGDPRHYRASIDKTLLPAAAESLGVRVPAYAVVAELAGARDFARRHGFPVVLKRAYGTAGQAVEVVTADESLDAAFRRLASAKSAVLFTATDLLIQAWIPGKGLLHAVAAWKGASLAGMTREVLQRNPATGPSTVVRCRLAPEARRFSELLAAGFNISGVFGGEFIEHEKTGETYLIEINRRVTNGVQMGGLVGVDLCGALAAAIDGRSYAGRVDLPPGEAHLIAEFPQEWLRDPASKYLRDGRTDMPWDEPELIKAMLALRPAG
jgi:predicted ATP-grasp superfamily ATP-dependent carboligase